MGDVLSGRHWPQAATRHRPHGACVAARNLGSVQLWVMPAFHNASAVRRLGGDHRCITCLALWVWCLRCLMEFVSFSSFFPNNIFHPGSYSQDCLPRDTPHLLINHTTLAEHAAHFAAVLHPRLQGRHSLPKSPQTSQLTTAQGNDDTFHEFPYVGQLPPFAGDV